MLLIDEILKSSNSGEGVELLTRQEVTEQIVQIFLESFRIDKNRLPEDYMSANLFGSKIGLAPRDALILLLTLEGKLKISLSSDDIVSGKFSTLDGIVGMVCEALQG